jgi:hypothetical protein
VARFLVASDLLASNWYFGGHQVDIGLLSLVTPGVLVDTSHRPWSYWPCTNRTETTPRPGVVEHL